MRCTNGLPDKQTVGYTLLELVAVSGELPADQLCRLPGGDSWDSFIIGIFRTESYIAVYRSREQYAFLRHKACNVMERMLCHISDVGSVYSNATFGNIKESRYEIYKR